MVQTRPLFVYFRPFSQCNDKFGTKFEYKRVYGVHGIRTRDRMMVDVEESTEHSIATLYYAK